MGITVDQGFDQTGILDPDDFVIIYRKFSTLKIKSIPFGLEFISPDVAFIKYGVINHTFAVKIASGQV